MFSKSASFRPLFSNWPSVLAAYYLRRHGVIQGGSKLLEFRNGVRMIVNIGAKDSSDLHRITQIWSDEVYTPRNFQVEPASLVIDIGAHIGAFSLYAASASEGVRVISYEPHPFNFARLTENVRLNPSCQIVTHNLAVAGQSGKVVLYSHSSNTGGHSILKNGVRAIGGEQLVDGVNLDDVFRLDGIDNCDLLKIDCEGAELVILRNASKNVLRRIKRIAMEYHSIAADVYHELSAILKDAGFAITPGPQFSSTSGLLYASYTSFIPNEQEWAFSSSRVSSPHQLSD